MKKRSPIHDDWATPKEFYDQLDKEFHFDFDPCPLRSSFDGLSISWGGSNFINPPYSRELKEKFIRKLYFWCEKCKCRKHYEKTKTKHNFKR